MKWILKSDIKIRLREWFLYLTNNQYIRPIVQKCEGIKKIPWISLTDLPTPVERLKGLEKELKFNGIWIKRDDITSKYYGGNKSRKLEYLLAKAKMDGKKVIKTVGGIGSNHAVATSIFCNHLGLKCKLYLVPQPNSEQCRKNLLLGYYYGAKLIYCRDESEYPNDIDIPRGGTSPSGNLGYVNAALELKKQIEGDLIPEPDYLFVTKGSSGTLSGLLLGLELLNLKTKLYGITIIGSNTKEDVINRAKNTWKLMKQYHPQIPEINHHKLKERLVVVDDFYGKGYGFPTKEGEEAINKIRRTDGIILDSTYTGKTLSGMISFIKNYQKKIEKKNILFWNTFNSISLDEKIKNVNYKELPKEFHKFFNGEVPLEQL